MFLILSIPICFSPQVIIGEQVSDDIARHLSSHFTREQRLICGVKESRVKFRQFFVEQSCTLSEMGSRCTLSQGQLYLNDN